MKLKDDHFKNSIKTFCKINNIPSQKMKFIKNNKLITISLKNHSENELDLECFNIIDFILNLIGPTETKFSQTTYKFPNSSKIDKINISFEENDYQTLIDKLFNSKS